MISSRAAGRPRTTGFGPSGNPAQRLHRAISAISRSKLLAGAAPGGGELTWPRSLTRFVSACAVYPLIGGGVAEWLKAAVC